MATKEKVAKVRSVNPWENILWSDEQLQILYRDLGLFYTHKQQLDIADQYYDKSLQLDEKDAKALFYRSKCKRHIAQTKGALEDSLAAARIDDTSAPINLEICDALYELNRFEDCKVELHDNTRKYSGKKVSEFLNRLIVVNENFKDTIGDTLGPFILKNEKHFAAVLEEIERMKRIDNRPLWKILKEQGKCDVLSILEKEEERLSPREIARRERAFRVFNQIYYNKSWIDVLFLKGLRQNPNMLLAQSKVSTPYLRHLMCSKYDILKKFLKMLQARSPLYNEQMRKCPDRKVWEKHREDHLNRVQYQTRRNMLTILRSIRVLRKQGKIEKLSRYVEEVMGDYVVLKTHRVMPWKFEFITEVYNTLALAHTDGYINVPEPTDPKEPLAQLLKLKLDKNKDRALKFVFGDRSTYQDAEVLDSAFVAHKKFLARLEKRIYFAKYGIERCYLLHEMARSHFEQSRLDECCSVARKAVEAAKAVNSHMWQFLSTMLIVKSHAVLHKVERGKEALDQAAAIASALKSPELSKFIDQCQAVNDHEILMKKRTQSAIRSISSRQSIASSIQSVMSSLQEEEEEEAEAEETAEER